MKVILNVDAISAPLTGIGVYTRHLARGLAVHPAVEDLRLFSAYRWVSDSDQALAVNRKIATLRRIAPFKRLALEGYTRLRAALFRRHATGYADHVLHSPNFVLMPFDGPGVATIHDLSWLRYPQYHPVERVRFLERHLPATLDRAAALIVDSATVRDELETVLGVDPRRVHVVPLGVDAIFHPRRDDELAPVLVRHGLVPRGYLLVVATLEPRKNLIRLVQAYAGRDARLRARLPLAVVGARGWLDDELGRALEPLERRGEVRRLGYVPEDDLAALHAGAAGFALPSLYEGFGLPVLEAMASGVPVLTSAGGALAEVAGDAALLVDPLDVDSIRTGLERLVGDVAWREAAARRGLGLAAGYAWSRCIEATLDVYRTALRAGDAAAAASESPAIIGTAIASADTTTAWAASGDAAAKPDAGDDVASPESATSPLAGAVLVNYNTASLTLRCVESLQPWVERLRLVVVDSGSRPEEVAALRDGLAERWPGATLIASPVNIGFAAGCNRAITRLLESPRISHVLLLNSDAIATPALGATILDLLDGRDDADLLGGRVLKMHVGEGLSDIDSLGIAFYRSLLASNRLDPAEPYFGPTGGCAVYARRVLEALRTAHGGMFDEDFFCYAEDTDVAARALLLGFTPRYVDTPLARHEGQASSGGGFNDFVLYHGIRNSIWMLVKCVPASLILRHLPWVLALHAGIVIRHSLRGKARVVFRLYRDALRRLPRMWRKRRSIRATRRIPPADFARHMSPHFYDRGYLRNALRELWGRGGAKGPPSARDGGGRAV